MTHASAFGLSRRSFVALSACALGCAAGSASSRPARAATLDDLSPRASVWAFSAADETPLRELGITASLDGLGAGEYASFTFEVANTGADALHVDGAYVTVDGGEPWGWGPFAIEPGQTTLLHVYAANMALCATEGSHLLALYVNDALVSQATLTLTREQDWASVFPLPTTAEIAAANAVADCRSPYVFGQWDTSAAGSFSDYSVDFKADRAPAGTYCCLFQWAADLGALQARYPDAHTESDAGGYGGLQVLSDGTRVAIMSLWDVYYTDESGVAQTLRARLVYPQSSTDGGSFGGEGEGAHCLVPYDWQPGRWYRMRFSCQPSEETGTILVDQWVCDLATNAWTHLCCYDTQVAGTCFAAPCFFFLENFDPATSGEVRCMEVADADVLSVEDGDWHRVTGAYLAPNGGRPTYGGSYAFGAQGSRLWAVTSGAGGDWYDDGRGQVGAWFSTAQ